MVDVALTSGLRVVLHASQQSANTGEPTFEERISLVLKWAGQLSEDKQIHFLEQFRQKGSPGDEGVNLPDLDFKRMMYLFVLRITLFPNYDYSINPRHFSFVDGVKNYKIYPWGVDVHDVILSELDVCKET